MENSNSRSADAPRTSSNNTPSSSRRTRSSSQPEDVPMDTDGNWKKVIPPVSVSIVFLQ
jgi:hypothetical protein